MQSESMADVEMLVDKYEETSSKVKKKSAIGCAWSHVVCSSQEEATGKFLKNMEHRANQRDWELCLSLWPRTLCRKIALETPISMVDDCRLVPTRL